VGRGPVLAAKAVVIAAVIALAIGTILRRSAGAVAVFPRSGGRG
jgi:hypothetical protein